MVIEAVPEVWYRFSLAVPLERAVASGTAVAVSALQAASGSISGRVKGKSHRFLVRDMNNTNMDKRTSLFSSSKFS